MAAGGSRRLPLGDRVHGLATQWPPPPENRVFQRWQWRDPGGLLVGVDGDDRIHLVKLFAGQVAFDLVAGRQGPHRRYFLFA